MEKFLKFIEILKESQSIILTSFLIFLGVTLINDYRQSLRRELGVYIKTQTEMSLQFKKYIDNSVQSSKEFISKKEIKDVVSEVFDKEVLSEIKKQGEEINNLHTAIININENVKNMNTASIDKNQIWGSDDKLDWLLFKDKEGKWEMDYTIHNDLKFDLLETKLDDSGVMNFRLKVKDNITGKTLPIQSFQTKINKNIFIKERKTNLEMYFGLKINNSIDMEVILGLKKGNYSLFGAYDNNGRYSVGIMRHINLF